jgi:hypothetical protein
VNTKQRKTLGLVFKHPTPAEIPWADIVALLRACEARIEEAARSRVNVELNGARATFHVPHPKRVAEQGRIRAVRRFLENAGVKP